MEEAGKYVRERPQRDYEYRTTLAIDWGSEAVRAKLLHKAVDGQITIDKLFQFTSTIDSVKHDRKELKRQHTSHIYPFGHTSPNPPATAIYPGNKRIMGKRSISSKIAMYAVVGISDEVAIQSPEIKSLCIKVEDNPQLKHIIRIGIEHMMECVLRNVHDYLALNRDLNPGAIALTIPAQWTIEFEEEYGERFTAAWGRVFGHGPPQIIFLSEGQTNAHYALWRGTETALSDRRDNLPEIHQDIFSIGESKNAVLFIDAGGHSTNTSLVTICEDGTQLEIRPDRGAVGGTSLWAMSTMRELRLQSARSDKPMEPPTFNMEMENEALECFYYFMYDYRDGADKTYFFSTRAGADHGRQGFELQAADIVEAFETVHKHVFALIEDGIHELKDLQPSCEKIKIVVGGGASQGFLWMDRMMALCEKHQLERPMFLWEIDQLYEHARLAGGANYALAEAKSVPQFVSKAAFGLAVKMRYQSDNGWTYQWGSQATLLSAHGHKWTRTVKTNGTQEFMIVCQPEFEDPQARSVIETDYRAYDLLPVPCRKRGALKFDFEIDTVNDKLKLKVMKKLGRARRWTELGSVEFNVWVPPGSRCLQIWECVEEIQARVTAAFSPEQQPAAVDEDVEMGGMDADEEDPDTVVVRGAAAGPRPRRRGSAVPTGILAQSGAGPSSRRA